MASSSAKLDLRDIEDGVINGRLIDTDSNSFQEPGQWRNQSPTLKLVIEPKWRYVTHYFGAVLVEQHLEGLHWAKVFRGYGSNDNRFRINEMVERMVCQSDCKYIFI